MTHELFDATWQSLSDVEHGQGILGVAVVADWKSASRLPWTSKRKLGCDA
jgi:hypothetical protein